MKAITVVMIANVQIESRSKKNKQTVEVKVELESRNERWTYVMVTAFCRRNISNK